MSRVRILLADDHETVREGLKSILSSESDLEVIGEADSGAAALDQTRALHPDIVVMDVSMPDMNGLQATDAIRQSCPGTRVVVLSRHAERGYVQQLLQSGASAYVLKQSRAATLVSALRTVARGGMYLDPGLSQTIARAIVGTAEKTAELHAAMSGREEEVLRLVAWGYSNKEIGAKLDISVKTVETHKANAMEKLDLHTRIDVVRFALIRGWLREP